MKHTFLLALFMVAFQLLAQNTSPSLTVRDADLRLAFTNDSILLSEGVKPSISYLLSLPEGSYGLDEKPYVHQLLAAEKLNINLDDLALLRRVRSIRVDNTGIYSYSYFKCHFSQRDGTLFFQKTAGSQRKSGYLYRLDSKRFFFLGGSTVNDDPLTHYGSDSSVAGMLYRVGAARYILLFPSDHGFEIYEFAK